MEQRALYDAQNGPADKRIVERPVETVVKIIQAVCALGAAAILGNWFLSELRNAQAAGKPWYAAYLTIPGIIIVVIVLILPIVIYLSKA